MGRIYYCGYIEDNELHKPIRMSGITAKKVSDLLKRSGVDVYRDLIWCRTDEFHNPLFYKTTKEWEHLRNDEKYKIESEPVWQEDFYMDEMTFPIVCNGIERNGEAFHLVKEMIKEVNINSYKPISITFDELAGEMNWEPDLYKRDIEEILNQFQEVCTLIETEKLIYWYRYY